MNKRTLFGDKPKRKLFSEIVAAILLLFFVHSFITTYIQLQSLKNMLAFYTFYTTGIAWSIVVTEGFIALLIFITRTRLVGYLLAILFSLTAIFAIINWPHYPHDFGGIANHLARKQHYFLYGFLALLGIIGIIVLSVKSTTKNADNSNTVVFT